MILKNSQETSALSHLTFPENVILVEVDLIVVEGRVRFGFGPRRPTQPTVHARVGSIQSSKDSTLNVYDRQVVYLSTQSASPKSYLSLQTSVYVHVGGVIELPEEIVIEKSYEFELCGGLMERTKNLTLREEGTLRMAPPAASFVDSTSSTPDTLRLTSLTIDYKGRLETSRMCPTSTKKTILDLIQFNVLEEFNLDTAHFSLIPGRNVTNYISPLLNATCSESDMYVYRNTNCTLEPGYHEFDSITIELGGVLFIEGDSQGLVTTTVSAAVLEVKSGGSIRGVGSGFQSGGPGQATATNQGATHGGSGSRNPVNPYGSITDPDTYGSNGHQATTTKGRGGGQIRLIVGEKLTLNGDIDMSGQGSSTSGGSGGSILVNTRVLSGSGRMLALGGTGGGGGGRISLTVNDTYLYTGDLSAAGNGQASAGDYILYFSVSMIFLMYIINLYLCTNDLIHYRHCVSTN